MVNSELYSVSKRGVELGNLLCVLFVGLKLTGNIDWPWVWVVAPIWVPLAIVAVVFVIAYVIFGYGRG